MLVCVCVCWEGRILCPAVCLWYQGSASVVSGTPGILLSSMNTDAVCERIKVMEGIDQSLLAQYTATIKKVLSVCVYERDVGGGVE